MSGYPRDDSSEELVGISTFWKHAKPGVLTDYVNENLHSVLLFDEIENAHGTVIRLFLQILDDGICFDRCYNTNISFEDTIIIFTTNAGKQRYRDAKDENLTALPDKVVIDALEIIALPPIAKKIHKYKIYTIDSHSPVTIYRQEVRHEQDFNC